MGLFRRRTTRIHEIAPDEIFLDSSNLPGYDKSHFEGRVEHPVARRTILSVGAVFFVITLVFGYRAFHLQVAHGDTYADISRNNTLSRTVLFATRGLVYDRNGTELAWNEAAETASSSRRTYARRVYTDMPGFAHVLGFVQYPKADSSGQWWREEYAGISGVELSFDTTLAGTNGSAMVERDAHGTIIRENIVTPPRRGIDLHLSIDADVQSTLHRLLAAHADAVGFQGGASVIMDVRTGEVIALTSFPEYDNQAFTDGDADVVRETSNSSRAPLLNRAASGLYTPGSIVKPMLAAAALNEGIITPEKEIHSTGALTVPNPYDPTRPTIFRDWTVHGWVDMRTAIAVSSDEYFYIVGGGFGEQEGLGIARIDAYAKRFGFDTPTGIALSGEASGVIPTPEWKARVFGADDPWRIGNTYHTSIGQYGFQITPLEAVRYVAAVANGGMLLVPHVERGRAPESTDIGIPDEYLQVVREGMRLGVTSTRSDATVKSLNIGGIEIAGKTGTAELGTRNQYMNSWVIGFWPADEPRYAFATVLEKAPAGTLSGAAPAMASFFRWLIEEKPEYVR